MHEPTYPEQEIRHRSMMHGTEQERPAAVARKDGGMRPDRHRKSGLVRKPGSHGSGSFRSLRPEDTPVRWDPLL